MIDAALRIPEGRVEPDGSVVVGVREEKRTSRVSGEGLGLGPVRKNKGDTQGIERPVPVGDCGCGEGGSLL
jgi:hypothetical protein